MTTLLVLDDDTYIPMLIESVVPPGWIVLGAPNGLVGLDLLRQLLTQRDPLDLIILDIQMPGLDGYDTAVRIRQLAPQTPIVFFTGLDTDADPELDAYAAELGCTLLRKRIAPVALGRAIQAAMQPPIIHWTAVLSRLQKKALDAEAQARQRVAIRVGLFATDPMWSIGVSSLLRDEVLVIGEAQTAEQLRILLAGRRIDMLVVAWQDFKLVQATQQPLQRLPVVVVVPNYITALALQRVDGVAGVVVATEPTTLIAAIQAVAAGHQYWPAPPTAVPDSAVIRAVNLTPRERELLAIDKPGVSVCVLAQALGVAPKTIEQYRWRIREKLEKADIYSA